MNTRFNPGDTAYHDGRPIIIASVKAGNGTTPLYSFFYTDAKRGVANDVPGRVISTRG